MKGRSNAAGPYGHRGRRAALHLDLVAAQCDLERGLGVAICDASYAALARHDREPIFNAC